MGNSQSAEHKPNSVPVSPASNAAGKQPVARRKESAQPLSTSSSRSSNAPISALVLTASPSTSTAQPTKAHATAAPTTASHTRARSITAPVPPHANANNTTDNLIPGSPSNDNHRPSSRSSTLPIPRAAPAEGDTALPASQPVDVPLHHLSQHESEDLISSSLPNDDSPYGHISSTFSRPPRLPLPIEEEAYTPGSPILSPEDISSPLEDKDIDGALPRRTSVLSSTTADDDEIGEHDLYQGDQGGITVPSIIEWKGAGDKVYVTGTFVMWEKKFKLHRNKDTGTFSTILQLKPGTHHIKFLVDDDMITSNDLPTTVDFTNILVNYIEIAAPLPESEEKTVSQPSEPVPIPGAAKTAEQVDGIDQAAAVSLPIRQEGHTETDHLARRAHLDTVFCAATEGSISSRWTAS